MRGRLSVSARVLRETSTVALGDVRELALHETRIKFCEASGLLISLAIWSLWCELSTFTSWIARLLLPAIQENALSLKSESRRNKDTWTNSSFDAITRVIVASIVDRKVEPVSIYQRSISAISFSSLNASHVCRADKRSRARCIPRPLPPRGPWASDVGSLATTSPPRPCDTLSISLRFSEGPRDRLSSSPRAVQFAFDRRLGLRNLGDKTFDDDLISADWLDWAATASRGITKRYYGAAKRAGIRACVRFASVCRCASRLIRTSNPEWQNAAPRWKERGRERRKTADPL